jgi:hypothetical protein
MRNEDNELATQCVANLQLEKLDRDTMDPATQTV